LYDIEDLVVGGHCGLCGKWIPNEIFDKNWSWGVCEDCKDVKILTKVKEGIFKPTKPKKYSRAKKYMAGGVVWHCFDLSNSYRRRKLSLYRTICKNCGRPYGEHSGTDGNKCPAGE
jgi:hypothetical protein